MWAIGFGFVLLGATACGASDAEPARAATEFPAGATVDYQLGGAYPPPGGVTLVVRDSTDNPAPGRYNVCYVNGFQSQPQDRDVWLAERRDLIVNDANGEPLVDENWPDEFILDTSTADRRDRLAAILDDTVGSCAGKGFDAVEFDNLDSFTRSKGALTADDNLALATTLTGIAHEAGLAAGQKNTAELAARGRDDVGFDFAVAEECLRWEECESYTSVYGQRVIDIEYTDDLPGSVEEVCAAPDRPDATVIRDRYLVPAGDPAYFHHPC
ncbi:endo alpha-1,4 polygalactosaminidase [Actinomycetes bacterium KLBMP 9797]